MRITWILLTAAVALSLGCRSSKPVSVHIDPELARLVPADTVALAGVKMEALRKTPFYEKYVAGRPIARLGEFTAATGLDPQKDLSEILVAWDGKNAVVMSRGKFDPAKLEALLERNGARRLLHRGHALIGNEEGAVVFLSSSTALAGRTAMLRSILDRREESSGPSQPLRELVAAIPSENQLWAASLGGFGQLPLPRSGNLSNLEKIAAMLETATLAADLRSSVHLVARGRCPSEQDAGTIETALRGFIGLGRLSTPDNKPELLRIYDSIQVSRQERSVRLDANVPLELIDPLLTMFRER